MHTVEAVKADKKDRKISSLLTTDPQKTTELEVLRTLMAQMATSQRQGVRVVYTSFPANNSDD